MSRYLGTRREATFDSLLEEWIHPHTLDPEPHRQVESYRSGKTLGWRLNKLQIAVIVMAKKKLKNDYTHPFFS